MFQSHEAEGPVEMVIRQVIYEDLKPQGRNQDLGVGYSCASGAFPACWGNSEASWAGLAAGDRSVGSEAVAGNKACSVWLLNNNNSKCE